MNNLREVYRIVDNGIEVPFFELLEGDQSISQNRFQMAVILQDFLQFGLTKDKLEIILLDMIKNIHSSEAPAERLQKISSSITYIQNSMQMVWSEDVLLQMASVYYFMENEPTENIDAFYMNRKIELWKNNKEAYVFFCKMGYERLKALTNLSWGDVENSIKYRRIMELLSK